MNELWKKAILSRIESARQMGATLDYLETYYSRNKNQACSTALHPDHYSKNFYPHLALPFDHNLINGSKGYFNASPMPLSDLTYIATQGPRHPLLSDFWEMVIEQKVGAIVSLTNLSEGEGPSFELKCHQFWPEKGDLLNLDGNLSIYGVSHSERYSWPHLDEKIHHRQLEIRSLKTKRSLIVHHLHVENWYDDHIIAPKSLLALHEEVETLHGDRPIVVHCAAGIGRTGTFIAAHSLWRDLKIKGETLLPEAFCPKSRVDEMRKYRYGSMIARLKQYHLVLDTLELFLNS